MIFTFLKWLTKPSAKDKRFVNEAIGNCDFEWPSGIKIDASDVKWRMVLSTFEHKAVQDMSPEYRKRLFAEMG